MFYEKTDEKGRANQTGAASTYLEKKVENGQKAPRDPAFELGSLLHDLRSVTGAVAGAAELLAATPLNLPQRELLETLRFGAENLKALAAYFSAFEKTNEAGKADDETAESFDLPELFESFQKAFQTRVVGRNVRFEAEANLPERDRFFVGDALALRKILMNLLENALFFTEKGMIRLSVRRDATIAVGEPSMLLFEVTDTGTGISATDLPRIFEPFFQGKKAQKGQGRGLGLAIVRDLAERLGGSVAAQSKPGQGARLQVRLPMEAADEPSESAFLNQKNDRRAAMRRSTVAGRTVLAVDDDALSRRLLGHMLEGWGCRFVLASTAQKGLEMAESHRFDLIFLDANLPDGDGRDLAEAIRTGSASLNHHAPLIGLSGFEADDRSRAAFDLFLEKPALPSVTLAAMHFLLKQNPEADAKSDLDEPPSSEPFALELAEDDGPDFSYLLDFCGQNGLFAAEIMVLFLKDAPERAAQLLAAAEKKDFSEVQTLAHAFKSDCLLMGLAELRQLAIDLQTEAKSAEPDAAHALFLARNLAERTRRALPLIEAARVDFLEVAAKND